SMRSLSLLLSGLLAVERVHAADVFAHFMVESAYGYDTAEKWTPHISLAQSIGIDGFSTDLMNIKNPGDGYEVDRLGVAFSAAEAASFDLIISFDMSANSWTQETMQDLISKHASSSAMYRWNDAVVVTTFSGDTYGNGFYVTLKSALASQGVTISFTPAFLNQYGSSGDVDKVLSSFSSIDGFANWWAWPTGTNDTLTPDADIAMQEAIHSQRTGPYIMAVSPWQFKSLGTGNNWVVQADTLFHYRWEQVVNDVKPDIVELISWNDFPESHYLGDHDDTVQLYDAEHYVLGYDHGAWRSIVQYYASLYKTGSATINDEVIYWYRTSPKAALCSQGERPDGADYPADAVFALALLADSTGNATISLDIGSSHAEFIATGGKPTLGWVSFPTEDNQAPSVQIIKDGQTTKSGTGSMQVSSACEYYNFNPLVQKV
ncbi:glycoside hydrolase family 71 protein, partial [Schizophyllum amplum]